MSCIPCQRYCESDASELYRGCNVAGGLDPFDRWAGLPRVGATRPGILMRRSSSLRERVSLLSGTYGSLGLHNPSTAIFAPGARH